LDDVTLVYLVQHGEKEPLPGDPGLTRRGQEQARLAGRRLRGLGISALYSSPMRRARETAEGIADAVPLAQVMAAGIPPCAVTAVDDPAVVMIASPSA
jgi:broad specificity phosphatase PhoE